MKLVSLPDRIHPSGLPHDLASGTGSASFNFHTVTWQPDGFGFDATSGEFFTASPTALIVMRALSEDVARVQILDRLTARFEVTQSTAERDLESFLAKLSRIGLIRESN